MWSKASACGYLQRVLLQVFKTFGGQGECLFRDASSPRDMLEIHSGLAIFPCNGASWYRRAVRHNLTVCADGGCRAKTKTAKSRNDSCLFLLYLSYRISPLLFPFALSLALAGSGCRRLVKNTFHKDDWQIKLNPNTNTFPYWKGKRERDC